MEFGREIIGGGIRKIIYYITTNTYLKKTWEILNILHNGLIQKVKIEI